MKNEFPEITGIDRPIYILKFDGKTITRVPMLSLCPIKPQKALNTFTLEKVRYLLGRVGSSVKFWSNI